MKPGNLHVNWTNWGSKSLLLVALAGAATGVVLCLETHASLVSFGAKSLLPALLVVSIIKESGPIITGLIVSGRVAAGIGDSLTVEQNVAFPLERHGDLSDADRKRRVPQTGLTAPAQEAVLPVAGGNVLRWPRRKRDLRTVDCDDGGAFRAVLVVGCLRCRSFGAPEILALA
jgi:hypothetical protein